MAALAALLTITGVALATDPAQPPPPLTPEELARLRELLKDPESTPLGNTGAYPVDMLWTVVAGILVFWMQAGFALLECGFTRAKNAVNILMKNVTDFSVGAISFWIVGFGLMFGASSGWIGTSHFAWMPKDDTGYYAFLFFQTVFAATAATIVSGAMAERTRFTGYIVYSVCVTSLIYPIFGGWAWKGLFGGAAGAGWLEAPEGGLLASMGLPGFIDFAGSTVVHSVGGWAALAGAIVLGPRIGKYAEDGSSRPIPGHSMVLATLGVMILWMGWFGFNAGSTTAVVGGGAAPYGGAGKAFALIAVNTNLAAAAGVVGAMVATWSFYGKPDIGIVLNGGLGGLVAITAPCASVQPWAAIVIGLAAGALVLASVELVDRMKVDDPVGAVSVHGVCGAWGTLSAAIFHVGGFSGAQLATQLIGVVAAFAWTFGMAFAVFQGIRRTIGLRVDRESEIDGLDISEHAAEAYPRDFTAEINPTP